MRTGAHTWPPNTHTSIDCRPICHVNKHTLAYSVGHSHHDMHLFTQWQMVDANRRRGHSCPGDGLIGDDTRATLQLLPFISDAHARSLWSDTGARATRSSAPDTIAPGSRCCGRRPSDARARSASFFAHPHTHIHDLLQVPFYNHSRQFGGSWICRRSQDGSDVDGPRALSTRRPPRPAGGTTSIINNTTCLFGECGSMRSVAYFTH